MQKPLIIFGPGRVALLEALDMPDTSTVAAMISEIARLKMAAAEGKGSKRTRSIRKRTLIDEDTRNPVFPLEKDVA